MAALARTVQQIVCVAHVQEDHNLEKQNIHTHTSSLVGRGMAPVL